MYDLDETLKKQQIDMNDQTINSGKWDSWLKPLGVGMSAVNMGLNVGMYGTNKKNIKAKTNLYNTQIADLKDQVADRKQVREHNREVMR